MRMDPIICMAHFEPLAGGSMGWLITGIVTALTGTAMLATMNRKRSS